MFTQHASLFEPLPIEPLEPAVCDGDAWRHINYARVIAWRHEQLTLFEKQPIYLAAAKAYYANHTTEFIMHWCDTFDPRRTTMRWLPFVLFPKQAEFIDFLNANETDSESGLCEKCRDVGATWLCVSWSIHRFLFKRDMAIGWGSRKQEYVDRIGDPKSIFEKLRQLLRRMPSMFLPRGFDWTRHAVLMKLINPENGSTVTGEVGDDIGRGGRTTIYFKDESAHYEHPEAIQAALDDNTNIQIDISSVNGVGNVFHRKREAGIDWPATEKGKTRVFVFDWSDHPAKNKEWFDQRRNKAEAEGLLHLFAQEVERNYAAAVQNTIIPMNWIIAARDAHLKIKGMLDGPVHGAMDIADGGGDTNAISEIKGVVLRFNDEWGDRDPGKAARRAMMHFRRFGKNIIVNYDNIGIGAAVKSEYNRLTVDEHMTPDQLPIFIGWNAGAAVQRPFETIIPDDDETPMNKDYFGNMKAQAWFAMRMRFLRTYQAIEQGVKHPPELLISLSTSNPLIRKLEKELAQPVYIQNSRLLMIIDKKPDGTKSPNLADSAVMGYFPIDDTSVTPLIGAMGNGNDQ